MGKAVQMFCSGDWDSRRVPQGTENLDLLLDAAPSHLPTRPQRCFTGGLILVPLSAFAPQGCIIPDIVNSATFGRVCAPEPGVLLICTDDNRCR